MHNVIAIKALIHEGHNMLPMVALVPQDTVFPRLIAMLRQCLSGSAELLISIDCSLT